MFEIFIKIFIFSYILIVLCCSEQAKLKFVWGDVFEDPEALDFNGKPYPRDMTRKMIRRQRTSKSIGGNQTKILTPDETRKLLMGLFDSGLLAQNMRNFQDADLKPNSRQGRAFEESKKYATARAEGCVPGRLCETSYNTTAPLYGISLTSGRPVTIVQKFPDLLQQVVYQVCKSSECDVLNGECVQTYIPFLFLTIPLGPVTLTGQDYILVENGCVCRPKYAKSQLDPPPIPMIQTLPTNPNF